MMAGECTEEAQQDVLRHRGCHRPVGYLDREYAELVLVGADNLDVERSGHS